MELLIVGIGARARNVGDKFFRAPLGEQPRPKLIAAASDGDNFDLRKFLLEVRENRIIATDVNNNLPFLLRRVESLLPLLLPSRLHLRSEGRVDRDRQPKENER
jgi:hypothetical protein